MTTLFLSMTRIAESGYNKRLNPIPEGIKALYLLLDSYRRLA